MGNYTPNPSMTQPIYDPTRPFATPMLNLGPCASFNYKPLGRHWNPWKQCCCSKRCLGGIFWLSFHFSCLLRSWAFQFHVCIYEIPSNICVLCMCLLQHKTLKTRFVGNLTATVPSHGCKMFVLKPIAWCHTCHCSLLYVVPVNSKLPDAVVWESSEILQMSLFYGFM